MHTLTISGKDPTDLHRDVLKSSTASIEIPELDFYMAPGSLGGIYTTIEGLLKQIHDKLLSANPHLRRQRGHRVEEKFQHIFAKHFETPGRRHPF